MCSSDLVTGGATINTNGGNAGGGGQGGSIGQGGDGGAARGGGLFVDSGSVTISGGAAINGNGVNGGTGGNGGGAASGGAGGAVEGGGVYVLSAPLTLTSGTATLSGTLQSPGINSNTIFAGRGGNGGTLGNGGAGGLAQGGGVFASGSNLPIILGDASHAATVNINTVMGGNGGNAGSSGGVGGDAGSATGGGVTVLGDKLTLTNATIASNAAEGRDGGIGVVSNGGNVISNYGAGGDAQGGGLFVSGSSAVTVLNSTFANDTAAAGIGASGGNAAGTAKYGRGGNAQGGALYAASSTVGVLNSTVADNLLAAGTAVGTANNSTGGGSAQGGGLFATGGSLALTNDTIAWNYLVAYTDRGATGGQGGGVYSAASNTLSLANTIIALDQLFNNSQTREQNGSPDDLFDTAAASDHNLIGDGTGSTLVNGTNGDLVGSDASPIDPLFAPALTTNNFGSLGSVSGQVPANYGGLTFTMPLTANSPALNKGDASTTAGSPVAVIAAAEGVSIANATDQRGLPRVINGQIDMGATQSGLLLTGDAPTTVNAGQTITYTFTLSNNGPSDLTNVTLSDPLPANTTFVSFAAPSGWTTSTPTVGGTGTVTANLATLAADTTATFTLVVQVNASASSGNIANNASVTYTGTANPVSSNLTLNTNVAGSTGQDITDQVRMFSTPIFRNPFGGSGSYVQAALFINESGTAINGPVALVLNGLPAGVTVTNADGTYNGSPYIDIEPPDGVWQPGVRYFLVAVINFSDPTHVKITYTPEIVAGI